MMESGIFLEERVREFCTKNNQEEGIYTEFIMSIGSGKQKEDKERFIVVALYKVTTYQ